MLKNYGNVGHCNRTEDSGKLVYICRFFSVQPDLIYIKIIKQINVNSLFGSRMKKKRPSIKHTGGWKS